MARICSCGFESNWIGSVEASVFSTRAIGPGRISGNAFTIQNLVSAGAPTAVDWKITFLGGAVSTTTLVEHYERFYIRLRAYPGANGLRFWASVPGIHLPGGGTAEGTDAAIFATIDQAGTISFWNKGNGAKTFYTGTVAPGLELNRWYRISLRVRYNDNGAGTPDTSLLAMAVDDVTFPTGTLAESRRCFAAGTRVTTSGLCYTGNQAAAGVWFGPRSGFADVETDGGILDIDDFSADSTVIPGSGQVTMVVPNGLGTYQGFTVSDWRDVAQLPPSAQTATPGAATSALTTINTVSFAMQSLAEVGVTGVVKAYNVAFYGRPARQNWSNLFRRNGVDNVGAPQTSLVNKWQGVLGVSLGNQTGWYLPAAALVGGEGSASDVLEVGMVDGTDAVAGTTAISACVVIVDHESLDPASTLVTPSGDLQVYAGSYTGNGTVQDIPLAFKPTALFIRPDTGNRNGAIWAEGFGPNGAFGCNAANQDASVHGIARVTPTGFTVWASAATGLNAAGVNVRFLAISDPARRLIQSGVINPNPGSNGAADNFNIPMTDPAFTPEAAFTFAYWTSALATSNCFYRGPAQTGDAASPSDVNSAEVADAIQSFGAGTLQLGRTAAGGANQLATLWLALRTAGVFNNQTALCQIGSFVGDGAASRTINFPTALTTAGLVLIVPANANEKTFRWGDQGDATSYTWVGGNTRAPGASSLTGFTRTGFTVATGGTSSLNAAGVRYNYLAFGGGTDPAEAPITSASTIGLTWVELLDAANTLHVWTKIALPDPTSYYGGFKEDRVTKWGSIQRALSDRNGTYESADFPWECSDTDRTLRALLANPSTQYLRTRPITVRMISDADRRLLKTPLTVFKGSIRAYQPTPHLLFSWTAQDSFADRFNAQSSTDQIPQRVITSADFPNAITAPDPKFTNVPVAVGKPVPIIYGEITDTQLVTAQLAALNLLVHDSSIPAPVLESIQRVTGLISDPINVYCAITAIKAGKEGPFSNVRSLPASSAGAATTFGVRVNWNAVPGVDSYRIYFADAADAVPYKTNGHAAHILYVEHDNVTVDGFNPPSYQVTLSDPSAAGVFDLLGGSASAQVDAGDGQCPLIYVGEYTLPDGAVALDLTTRMALAFPVDNAATNNWNAYRPPFTDGVHDALLAEFTAANGAASNWNALRPASQPAEAAVHPKWRKFLVCGHAVKAITEVYTDNNPLGIGAAGYWPASLTTPASFGPPNNVNLIVPGTQSWTAMFGASAPPYEDINGNRYTVIYGKVGDVGADKAAGFTSADAGIPAAVSVKGIESNGDGTGTLITDALLQYRHCAQNWIFGSYRSGAWLASPTFADDPALAMIDDASFDRASNVARARIANGYVGAGIIGWSAFDGNGLRGGERVSVRDLIARWNQSCDVDSGFNRKGQFFVSMEQETAALISAATALTDVNDVLADTLEIVDKFEEHFNELPFKHTEDYFGRDARGWRLVDTVSDAESIAHNQGRRQTSPEVALYFIRGLNRSTDYAGYAQGTLTATDVMRRRLRRVKNPPRYATFQVSLSAVNFELGDIITITHYAGVGATGWVNHALRVVRILIDPDAFTTEITAYDIQVLYEIGFLLGDETVLPGTIGTSGSGWSAATQAQQIYAFLGDENTAAFGNGDPIKRLG